MANPRPFMDFLREHRAGATHDELSDALQALVGAVVAEGKAGTLNIAIALKPMGRGANVSVLEGVAPDVVRAIV